MKYIILILLLVNCTNETGEDITLEQPKEPETIEVCDECTRYWYSNGVFINARPWGWEGCEADGNVYKYEDRDGTNETNHYPSNPGSYYVIRCTKKTIEL